MELSHRAGSALPQAGQVGACFCFPCHSLNPEHLLSSGVLKGSKRFFPPDDSCSLPGQRVRQGGGDCLVIFSISVFLKRVTGKIMTLFGVGCPNFQGSAHHALLPATLIFPQTGRNNVVNKLENNSQARSEKCFRPVRTMPVPKSRALLSSSTKH